MPVQEYTKPSDEKRKEYASIRDSFHAQRKQLTEQISSHKSEMSSLEKKLREAMPVIEGCDNGLKCVSCDVYSMQFNCETPGQGETKHWYRCVICNHEDYTI